MLEHTDKEIVFNDDEECNVYYLLQEYADRNPKFSTKFLDSLEKFLIPNGFISGSQCNVLIDIYNKIVY